MLSEICLSSRHHHLSTAHWNLNLIVILMMKLRKFIVERSAMSILHHELESTKYEQRSECGKYVEIFIFMKSP